MVQSRKLVVYLLLALMFVVAVPAASAAPRETTTQRDRAPARRMDITRWPVPEPPSGGFSVWHRASGCR